MRKLAAGLAAICLWAGAASAACVNSANGSDPPVWVGCEMTDSILRHNTDAASFGTYVLRASGEMYWGPGGDAVPDINLSRRRETDSQGNTTMGLSAQASANAMSRLSWRNDDPGSHAAAAVSAMNGVGGAMLLVTGENADHYEAAGLWPNEAAVTSDSTLGGLAIENSTAGGYIRFVKNTREVARFGGDDRLQLFTDLVIHGSIALSNRPAVTGSRSNGEALANLLQALHTLGLITDQTTP